MTAATLTRAREAAIIAMRAVQPANTGVTNYYRSGRGNIHRSGMVLAKRVGGEPADAVFQQQSTISQSRWTYENPKRQNDLRLVAPEHSNVITAIE